MTQDQDETRKPQKDLSIAPSKARLVLPHGDTPDIDVEDLLGADVVEANDSDRFVVLFIRPNRTVMVPASPANIAALKAFTAVREYRSCKVLTSEDLLATLEGLDVSSPGEIASEIVYIAGCKTLLVHSSKIRLYFRYDASVKELLEKRGMLPGLNLGGTRDIGTQLKND